MRLFACVLILVLVTVSDWASAQTVQLPTYTFFGVSTTVSVPDNGAAFLGGINRAASGGNEFGVPGLAFPGLQNRSIGQNMSASNVWASVTIHDLDAMDQAILNSPSPTDLSDVDTRGWNAFANLPAVPRTATGPQLAAVNLAGSWQSDAPTVAPGSKVAAEEKDREAQRFTRSSDADSYFAQGQQAEADGKPGIAKIYYQMAARRASGDLKRQVQARLDAISGHTSALAKNSP
jgi:hypothetical protein